ncbi:unnamed protein product [Rhodiola kirilowii]
MEDYRPISLCNVIVKLVTKVLANRLKQMLPAIISESQSAFMPGRLISDNILAAHELFHFIKTRNKQKGGFFVLKLDMNTTYDRVEWDFLEAMLLKLGFPEVWVKCVMTRICSVRYAVRVNDTISKDVWPERGIHQGDPLTPYLFLICIEWLTTKLSELQNMNKIQGVKICRGAPEISHLLFADDSMFFLKVDIRNANNLKQVLKEYELLLGQMINFAKSEIFFSQNVDEELREGICGILGVGQVTKISRYLGLPVMFSHNKTELFQFIIEKVWKRVQGWKEKMLSMAGKEILIKAVIQSIPTYAMMCFKIPDLLIKRNVSIVSKYWWSNGEGNGIHWCSFEKLCRSKVEGGLGFRELGIFNEAMLAKQVWRLLQSQDSLTSKLLKTKYYREGNVFDCHLGARPSVAMRSIWNACTKIKQWIEFAKVSQRPIWMGESNGIFFDESDQRKVCAFWKIIWRLQIQPKVKVFAWRLYHDFLPSAKNLIKKGCQVQAECTLHGSPGESTTHSLLRCWWARIFWTELGIDLSFLNHDFEDPGAWLWFCAFHYPNRELGIILQGARQIWFNRNLIVNGKGGLNPWSSARSLNQWLSDQQDHSQRWIVTELCGETSWRAPKRGFIKFNVNGAWDVVSGKSGIGVCGRDDLGFVWLAEARWLGILASSQEVEAMALLRALELAEEKQIRRTVFETDCAFVFKMVTQGSGPADQVAVVIQRCRDLFEKNSLWSLDLIFREANSCADKLAKEAKYKHWSWSNQSALPICLSSVV